MTQRSFTLGFDGALLERGFWLYVWRIEEADRSVSLYVGRTGDSSSPHASSPFQRVARHLDPKPTAKSNSLYRKLNNARLCRFDLVAVGPFFAEVSDFEEHKVLRDEMAGLEEALARFLDGEGYNVVGVHGNPKPYDEAKLATARKEVESFLEKFPRPVAHGHRSSVK